MGLMPVLRGVIDRRILVNYRVEPERLRRLLPAPFRPQLVDGYGIAGVCSIRLAHLRPRGLPALFGFRSENAAHRIAVEWGEGEDLQRGVFIPRRDTSSALNALLGGRLVPGRHHRARFTVREQGVEYDLSISGDDPGSQFALRARESETLPATSVLSGIDAASDFFANGACGYTPTDDPRRFVGLELDSFSWQVQPLEVEHLTSAYFEDTQRFPVGTAVFDCALLMRGIEHAWRALPDLVRTEKGS